MVWNAETSTCLRSPSCLPCITTAITPVAAFVSPIVSPVVRKILLYSCILDRLCFEWQIVVATPGRLCEVVFDRRRLKLGSVKTLVLDEVDALLRSPYVREVDAIVDAVPSGVCVCVFFPCLFLCRKIKSCKTRVKYFVHVSCSFWHE